MRPRGSEDSFFSSGKPKNLPRFYILIVIGILIAVFLYKWFD